MIDALHYVHDRGFAHRDIKSENMLVRTQPYNNKCITEIRLIDFGIACRPDDDEACKEVCGTPGFIAPEIMMKQVKDIRKADVWSLACVVLERIIGSEEFDKLWKDIDYKNFSTLRGLRFFESA